MNAVKKWAFRLLMVGLVTVGCSIHEEILPVHDEVLIYNLPHDLTYLRATEAIESLEDWDLIATEKEKGIIKTRNINYLKPGDADKRVVRVYVLRKNRFQTEVKLAEDSQHVLGGGDILERISEYLAREL